MANANRSFTLDNGLKYSHFAYIVLPGGQRASDILTSGVLPTAFVLIRLMYCKLKRYDDFETIGASQV